MKELELKYEEKRAWESARTLSIIVTCVSAISSVVWFFIYRNLVWQWYISTLVSLILLAFVLNQPRLAIWASGTIFLVLIIVATIANTITNCDLAKSGVPFEPFGAVKLAPFIVAIIAPSPIWIGYVVMGASLIAPLALYFGLYTPEMRAQLAIQEPWYSQIFVLVAFFLLRHRLKVIEMERTMARLKAERKAIDDLARIFLGLRDLTNTPLQAIELTSKLLGTQTITSVEAALHLERSLIRLRELSSILCVYEKDINWENTLSSFDAVNLLQEKLAEMDRGSRSRD